MNIFETAFETIINWFLDVGDAITSILPLSPFMNVAHDMPNSIREVLGFVNWFVPISDLIVIFITYGGIVVMYMGVMAIMRYFGIITS